MKCPLIKEGEWVAGHQPVFLLGDCLQEDCARWDKTHGICGDLSQAAALWSIKVALEQLAEELQTIIPPRG